MTGVGTLQSGPAGGMIATAFVAKVLGHPNVITGDMGGTSFDVGLLTDYRLSHAREPIAERFRLLQPMINVESIGAGGGTIARIDPVTGRLLVGPDSAGADPGPIVYGMGGTHVTVTDANVALGYIDPDYFLGGRRKLDKRAAEAAIEKQIGDYYLFEIDKNPVACVALHLYPEQNKGELAFLFVNPSHENQGIGRKLVQFVETKARELGVAELITLSTQAFTWFQGKAGFVEGSPDDLPPHRRERYDSSGRHSKVLVKKLR
jgi:N-methylhydantoinase A/oxoprolinase/acetone carboxylase beta subunit